MQDMAFSWDGKLLAVLTAETDNELLILEWQAPADRRLKWRIPLGAGFSHVSFCPTDNDQLCITGATTTSSKHSAVVLCPFALILDG